MRAGPRVQSQRARPTKEVRDSPPRPEPACKDLGNRPGNPFYSPEDDARDEHGRVEREEKCKAICAGCELRKACLEFVLIQDETWADYGVWGGMTEGERREFREWYKRNFEGEKVPPAPKLWIVLGKFWSSYHFGARSEPD